MALKSKTKGTPEYKRRQSRVRLRKDSRQAFDPLQNPYKTQGDFNRAVTTQARAGYQPQLGELRTQGSQEDRKHTTRGGEIESLYNSYGNELQKSYDQTTGALNNLVALQQGSSSADQAALRAALGASQGQQSELAQRVGAQGSEVPSSAGSAATLLPAWGTAEAGKTAFGSSVAAAIAEAAQRRSLPALGKIRASEDESRRHFGRVEDLSGQRRNIMGLIPGLRLAARKELMGEAQQTQNLGFQQKLAGKQFGLDVRRQSHQEAVDQTAAEQRQQEIDAAVDGAGSDQEAADAEAYSKAYATGRDYMDSYLKPSKGEQTKKGKTKRSLYKRSPEKAFKQLTTTIGLNDHDALVLINTVGDEKFRNWVKRYRWRQKHPGESLKKPSNWGGAPLPPPAGKGYGLQ